MGELEREDIAAALLLSWLKYTAVSKQDVQNMATIFYEKKESKKLQKSRRKISKPIPKKIRISPSTLTNLPSLPPVQNLRGIIGTICSDPFQKQLTKSDVDEHQGRLLLNNEDARSKLLPLLNGVVLLGSWRQFVKDHKLKENDYVTVWMFRHRESDGLCFAITWKSYNYHLVLKLRAFFFGKGHICSLLLEIELQG
ncbi:uncharacterized protein [Nicotiana tomentosiformis]|uniref:uncharacterized protein n=1 Tax=Nicotiana tomentosiformis TaxID=4098 RepID=UPI00388C90C7